MNQSTRFYGSICYTDLLEQLKKRHSAFTKGENGKIYVNVNLWVNDEKDKFGNNAAIMLNSTKENRESEGKVYIGNFKKAEQKSISESDYTDHSNIDLPVAKKSDIPQDDSGLPF